MQTIVLIPCVKEKRDHACPARELYEGDYFQERLRYAESLKADHIFILSGKYGLLTLQAEIAPYDVNLHNVDEATLKQWSVGVLEQLKEHADLNSDLFVILVDEVYRRYLLPDINNYKIIHAGDSMHSVIFAHEKSTLMITEEMIHSAQWEWADGIIAIGKLKDDREACVARAKEMILALYDMDKAILFKPTLAAEKPMRHDLEGSLSYFVGGNDNYAEDHGFAIKPWTAVRFENAGIQIYGDSASAMGHYFFTDLEGGVTKVEYTFVYVLTGGDRLSIKVHHSSLPYSAG